MKNRDMILINICKTILCVSLVFAIGSLSEASSVYNTYTYSNNGEVVFSPDIYETQEVLYGSDIGVGFLSDPQDMCFDNAGNLYILDASKKSVTVIDRNHELVSNITVFSIDGADSPLMAPTGVFSDSKGNIYICDGGNRRIIRCDINGVIDLEIRKPESVYFPESVEFIPKKMLLDSAGNMYVSSIGIASGLMIFDAHGKFLGFYGAPKVASSMEVLTDYFWRFFMTDEQKEAMAGYVPPEVANLCITDDDFIVTVTNAYWDASTKTKMQMDSIRMLNPKGMNVLDMDTSRNPGAAISKEAVYLNFTAVCIDDLGFLTLIDNQRGKIYQFDSNFNLIAAFGAIGQHAGAFSNPAAIETYDDKLYVLDSLNCSITVFKLTEYGEKIHHAITVYSTENQSEAIKPWQDVLELNSNYDLAYVGIGNVLLNQGNYTEAMRYFKLGHESSRYNAAFRQSRLVFFRANLALMIICLVALFATVKISIWVIRKKTKERGKTLYDTDEI